MEASDWSWEKVCRILAGAQISLEQPEKGAPEFPEDNPPEPAAWQREESACRERIDALVHAWLIHRQFPLDATAQEKAFLVARVAWAGRWASIALAAQFPPPGSNPLLPLLVDGWRRAAELEFHRQLWQAQAYYLGLEDGRCKWLAE